LIPVAVAFWSTYRVVGPLDHSGIASTKAKTLLPDDTFRQGYSTGRGEIQQPYASRPELSRLEARLDHLTRQIEAQAKVLMKINAVIASNEESSSDGDSDADMLRQAEEQAERDSEEQFALLEQSVHSEAADPEWSTHAIAQIEQILANDGFANTKAYNIDCRATLCKVEVAHNDPDAFADFQMQFPMQVANILPQTMMTHEDTGEGQTNTVVYLAGEGYSLPNSEP